jgi:hypothetical protein
MGHRIGTRRGGIGCDGQSTSTSGPWHRLRCQSSDDALALVPHLVAVPGRLSHVFLHHELGELVDRPHRHDARRGLDPVWWTPS